MDKTVRVLVRKAEQQGFRIEHTTKGRVVFLAPDGVTSVVGCADAGDGRALKNLTAQLRRAGLQDRTPKKEKPVPAGVVIETVVDLDQPCVECPHPEEPAAPKLPWGHWTDAQVAHLRTQGYSADFVRRRTGR